MGIPNLYSFRNKEIASEYQFDIFDGKLKNQVILTWEKFYSHFGRFDEQNYRSVWILVEEEISMITGHLNLNEYLDNPIYPYYIDRTSVYYNSAKVNACFTKSKEINDILSIVESVFSKMIIIEGYWIGKDNTPLSFTSQQAVADLNTLIEYGNLGYEFVNGQIIKKDNKLLHKEIINPVLHLLSNIKLNND